MRHFYGIGKTETGILRQDAFLFDPVEPAMAEEQQEDEFLNGGKVPAPAAEGHHH